MNVNVPACAGGMPPETGASRNSAEGTASLTALSTSKEALASIVEVSRNSLFESFVQPARRPVVGSRKTTLTACAFGRDDMMTSYGIDQIYGFHKEAILHDGISVMAHLHTHFSAISFGLSAVSIVPSTVLQNSSRAVLLSSHTRSFADDGIFCLTFFAIPNPILPKPMKP
jgi:hypothetical protein